MKKIDNYLTKLIHNTNCYCILSFYDFDMCLQKDLLEFYLNTVIRQYHILKMKIENNSWVYPNELFDLKDYYAILSVPQKDMDSYTNIILNEPFLKECKWHCTVLNDLEKNQSRLYFKIDHSYCDGYKLIEILTVSFLPNYVKPNFKRTVTNPLKCIYYYFIGTIILFLTNIRILWNIFFNKSLNKFKKNIIDFSKSEAVNVNCGSLDLDKIKNITTKYGVTVNSFLYSLMVITWYNYTEPSSEPAITISPINMNTRKTASYNTNNIFFIFTEAKKENDPIILLKTADELFNLYKLSLYVPIANRLVNLLFPFIPQCVSTEMINESFSNIDITYSNVIGPAINENENILKLRKGQFTVATKNNETCFNIVSFANKVNINISFRKGVITDTERFIQSFENASKELLAI